MTQRVVIVDDDELNLRLLGGVARELRGVVAETFTSSERALAWIEEHDADCFIFDYHMPAPDGLEMIARVRAMDRFAIVPIVIVTGEAERDVRYRAFDAGANDFILRPFDRRELIARLGTLLALADAQRRLAMQVESLEASLLDSEARSRQHAERLEALWRIVNNPSLAEEDLVVAMMRQGAAAIRPGQPFMALLSRIEGDDIVTEAAATVDPAEPIDPLVAVGARIPLARTRVAEYLASGGTHSQDDALTDADSSAHVRALGWRAMITAFFRAGGAVYVLLFASTQPTLMPFGPQDHAYAEVIAAFFATHFQQRWQSLRIRDQLDHDSLTGLNNRSRFRSLGRAAFDPSQRCAIAVLDLDDFQALNERYGHLTGDAVLVEVAAALAEQLAEDELAARVGGDSFAVFFPRVPSREWLEMRAERLATIFDTGIPIGDREGRETVVASGTIGIALAPDDATTFDQLLFRSEGATSAAQSVPHGRIRFFERV